MRYFPANLDEDLAVSKCSIGALTAGSVLFAGSADCVDQDNSYLYWSTVKKSLGIGTNGIYSYSRIHTEQNFYELTTAPATSLIFVAENNDSNGSYPVDTNIYYKVFAYVLVNGLRKYSAVSNVLLRELVHDFGSIDISWTASANADGYVVYRSFDALYYVTGTEAGLVTSFQDNVDVTWDLPDIEDLTPSDTLNLIALFNYTPSDLSKAYAFFDYSGFAGNGYLNGYLGGDLYIGKKIAARYDATDPTAAIHIQNSGASAGAVSTAPLKFNTFALMTVPEAGAFEFLSTNLYFTPSTKRKRFLFEEDLQCQFLLMGA